MASRRSVKNSHGQLPNAILHCWKLISSDDWKQSHLKVRVSIGQVTAEVAIDCDGVVQSELRGRLRKPRSHSHMQQKRR